MFDLVKSGQSDPMFELKKQADNDSTPGKVDLGVGIYRNEAGKYHELSCLKKAKTRLNITNPSHDYELTTGNVTFLRNAASVVFGGDLAALLSERIASVQTISGTGANHLGASLISRCAGESKPKVFIGTPAWGNYEPLFKLAGLEVSYYNHYDAESRTIDFEYCMNAVRQAPKGSVFVLQGCCHNPTGADFSRSQWQILAEEMQRSEHYPFFDIAYQGLGDGLNEDAFGVRHFAGLGFEMVVCQSFSKNFGLYGERVGALHVLCKDQMIATNVRDQLRNLIRWEFSSSPAYGSRLVTTVLEDEEAVEDWMIELHEIRQRLNQNRSRLFKLLSERYSTPGNWSHILREKGLFSYLALNPDQCRSLREDYHIYLPSSGRINISGLSASNVERVACAIDEVVRKETKIVVKTE